ncbi:MAG: PilZ domain-containing protein [Syntrophotaleaceae bacterium]
MMVEQFADCVMVNVTVPMKGRQVLHVDGVLRNFSPPHLEIQFPTQPLPLEAIDPGGKWRVTFDKGIAFLTAWADLVRAIQPNLVLLFVTNSEISSHVRRDYRIDTEIYLRYWQGGEGRHRQKPQRARVNLSGYGISFRTTKSLPPGGLMEMEMHLPGATLETVRCLGRVIRTVEKSPGFLETAFELVNLQPDDREKITHFSMTEQFKAMQNKNRIFASTLQDPGESSIE